MTDRPSPLAQMSDKELAELIATIAGSDSEFTPLRKQILREAARRLRAERRCEAVYREGVIEARCDLPIGHEENHKADGTKGHGALFMWPHDTRRAERRGEQATCEGDCNPSVAECGARFCTYEAMARHECDPAPLAPRVEEGLR